MKKQLKITLALLTILSVLLVAGCDKKTDKEISLGEINENTYTNDYFGFSAKIPEEWNILDDETTKEIMDTGKDVIAGDDKELEKKIDLAELKSLNFFMATKYSLEESTGINPNLICNAEKLNSLQGIKNATDYLEASKKQLEKQEQIPYKFEKDIYTEKIDGKDFAVLEGSIETEDVNLIQKYYSIILDKYAVNFIVFYSEDDGQEDIDNFINSIKFNE